jgi:hypothetical protein
MFLLLMTKRSFSKTFFHLSRLASVCQLVDTAMNRRRGYSPIAPDHPTLAITWPQGVLTGEDNLGVAAQVHGVVGWFPG